MASTQQPGGYQCLPTLDVCYGNSTDIDMMIMMMIMMMMTMMMLQLWTDYHLLLTNLILTEWLVCVFGIPVDLVAR